MAFPPRGSASAPRVSIGIIAWNEEKSLGRMLDSLFEQSLFEELARRCQGIEVHCIANGCQDRTAEVASHIFAKRLASEAGAGNLACRVSNLEERGKMNAWNQFVHVLSAPAAEFLFLMDADIVIHRRGTLWAMLRGLAGSPQASIAVDRAFKDIELRAGGSAVDRLSLAVSRLTRSSEAQLCGQLYCIRAATARRIWLPRELAACDDGFIKAMVCTDGLTGPVEPRRILDIPEAAHLFEAYTSPADVLRNQKRQVIGQTFVHVLVDQFLKAIPLPERSDPAGLIRKLDREDPGWLQRLVADHVRRVHFFWHLYPGLLTSRFRSLSRQKVSQRIRCFPAALAGSLAALISGYRAWAFLRAGRTHYWPRQDRSNLRTRPDPERRADRHSLQKWNRDISSA